MRQLSADEVRFLARSVRRHRRALGLRPAELAEFLGVSTVYLTALEMGAVARPRPEALAALARLLDLEDWTDLLRPDQAGHAPGGPRALCPPETPTADSVERFLRRLGRSHQGSA